MRPITQAALRLYPRPVGGCRWLALVAGLVLAASAPAATYTVNSLYDDGDLAPGDNICDTPAGGLPRCTLRAAIEESNAHAGADRIEFELGPLSIVIGGTPLPTIVDHLVIDGRTAPQYNAAAGSVYDAPPSIYITGHMLTGTTADGFRIDADSFWIVEIHAIGIINFPDNGIELVDGVVTVLDGNWIGIGRTGGIAGNGGDGVRLNACDRCGVGRQLGPGTAPVVEGIGNVVSNNAGAGVYVLSGDGNVIAGNYIGMDPVGGIDQGNAGAGVHLVASGSSVGAFGGIGAGEACISNNIFNSGGDGIRVQGSANRLYCNIVRENGGNGVSLNGTGNWLGGDSEASGNAVGGNGGHGVVLGNLVASHSNLVRNASIFSNGGRGVQVTDGGTNVISDNEIHSNADDAVRIDAAGNEVRFNRIGFRNDQVWGNAANGVVLAADDVSVVGNRIAGMEDDGVDVFSGAGAKVYGNEIGTSHDGANWGNLNAGIRVRAAASNVLLQINTVGFNHHGLAVDASGAMVCGNYIGLGLGGQLAGNASEGVWLVGSGNQVGSEDGSCTRNVIGDNGSDGIEVWGADNLIAGNQIGRNAGVAVGNHNGGILLHAAGATNNRVLDNLLWNNASDGVRVTASAGTGNTIQGNSFGDNGGQGIDLLDDGLTANDEGDADTGPNRLLNTPVITSAIGVSGQVAVTFHVDAAVSAAAYPLEVEFHLSGPGDHQGSDSLQRETYDTPGASITRFIALPPGVGAGDIIATSTDALGNTSEFSAPQPFVAVPLPAEVFSDGFEG